MSTELERSLNVDCYGMTAEVRAEFEEYEIERGVRSTSMGTTSESCGIYQSMTLDSRARLWAACANLYRERLHFEKSLADEYYRQVKELEAENERLEGEAMARSQDDGKLEREIERLRADAARLDYIQRTTTGGVLRWFPDSPGSQTVRDAIDAAMKGGE